MRAPERVGNLRFRIEPMAEWMAEPGAALI
jgi:hypothetical protein